jgi:WD40 repeat protein
MLFIFIRIPEGNILAVGNGTGSVELWDVTRTKQLRVMRGHTDRVPVLGWNAHVLASGCRNGQVWLHDVRVAQVSISSMCYEQLLPTEILEFQKKTVKLLVFFVLRNLCSQKLLVER